MKPYFFSLHIFHSVFWFLCPEDYCADINKPYSVFAILIATSWNLEELANKLFELITPNTHSRIFKEGVPPKPINASKKRTPIEENAKYCSLKRELWMLERYMNISLHCLSTDKCSWHYKKGVKKNITGGMRRAPACKTQATLMHKESLLNPSPC